MKEYEIQHCRNFYGIFHWGQLIQTADTLHEAEQDLEEILQKGTLNIN